MKFIETKKKKRKKKKDKKKKDKDYLKDYWSNIFPSDYARKMTSNDKSEIRRCSI